MSAAQDTQTAGAVDVPSANNSTPPEQSAGPSGSEIKDTPLPRGYEIKGLAKPGDYDHVDMYEGIDSNENMENAFKLVYLRMLDLWERGLAAAAEAEANRLLGWDKIPVLYRAYAHIVSSTFRPIVSQGMASRKEAASSCAIQPRFLGKDYHGPRHFASEEQV